MGLVHGTYSNGFGLVFFGFFKNGLDLRPKQILGQAKFTLDTNQIPLEAILISLMLYQLSRL